MLFVVRTPIKVTDIHIGRCNVAISLTTCKANTRGKNTREIQYEGIGKLVVSQVPVKDDNNKTVKKDGKVVTEPKENLIISWTEKDGTEVHALKDVKDAMELSGGNTQFMLDRFAEGYNDYKLRLASDQLAQYINPAWTAEQVSAFRLAVNNLLKLDDSEGALQEAVDFATMKINKGNK